LIVVPVKRDISKNRMKEELHMRNEGPMSGSANVAPAHVIALPIALYESNGLIYELYQGGQPYQAVVIRWERLKTVTVTREENGAADVHINQGRRVLIPHQQE
jgi:hypothetical protein